MLNFIDRVVRRAKKDNRPNKKVLRGVKLLRYSYYDTHALHLSDNEYTVEQDDWDYLVHPIAGHLKSFAEYQKLEAKMLEVFPNFKPENLANFTQKAALLYLNNRANCFLSPSNQILGFFKELRGERLEFRTELVLSGIALSAKKLKIANDVYITRTTRSDYENPIPVKDFYTSRSHYKSGLAKLQVSYFDEADHIDFHKHELFLSILRLYKVGEIHVESHSQVSECSGRWYMESPYYTGPHYSIFTAMLTKKDEKMLAKFWKVIEPLLPNSFKVPINQRDSVTIAYQRYLEAMTHSGNEEMRIAYTVASLEALFSTENDELKYRLRMRVARFLSVLGLNAEEIYRDVGLAYDVRSKFDHGDTIDDKLRRKIRSTYNTDRDRILTLIMLDYVRISLVAVLMIRTPKGRLVDLIDKTWFSESKYKELRELLRPTKKLLNIDPYRPKYHVYDGFPNPKHNHCYIES